jgi:hypothetical protein
MLDVERWTPGLDTVSTGSDSGGAVSNEWSEKRCDPPAIAGGTDLPQAGLPQVGRRALDRRAWTVSTGSDSGGVR